MSSSPSEPVRSTYVGLFLTTLSLLQLELFLTRIFSVTMWYHFAFMAISLAMFGIAAGAVLVELARWNRPERVLAKAAWLYSVGSALCFAVELYIPVNPEEEIGLTALAFGIISIPFVFAGIVVCVSLTRFPGHTGSLYAADLAGSAAGCVLAIPILNHLDAPTAVIVNSAIAALAAYAFGLSASPRIRRIAGATCLVLLVVAAVNPSMKLVDIRWVKGGWNWGGGLYEKWNAFSRIYIVQANGVPFGWGMSPTFEAPRAIDQLYLNIDSGAATVITKFDGNLEAVAHLKYDVTALAHYLRANTSVLVIGVGGGRDILTALVFGQRRVVGVEINPDILNVLTSTYADYSGNLHRLPGVTLVNDEARSYVARSKEKFGIIQASLIDTWAATSAGAYVLTENGLYTKEAWLAFFDHLEPGGILTMSRWHNEAQPAETLRLCAIATAALLERGVQNPRGHMMVVRKQDSSETGQYSVATILVSPRPFTAGETARITNVSGELEFIPVLTPEYAETGEFAAVADPARYARFVESYPLNIRAPTDDTPFFFHMLRAGDLLHPTTYQGMNRVNVKAVKVLGVLLAIVFLLSVFTVVFPLFLRREVRKRQTLRLAVYFGAIGLAFMLVEIGQLERLIIFLGHPIYGLSVVLFVLLLASSAGSAQAARFGRWIGLLPVVLLAFILLSPMLSRSFSGASTPARIGISVALLFPAGFFMGMAFPVGMERASFRDASPMAWYWGINGALSVISSVLAVAMTIFWGVTATLVAGLSVYALAILMLKPLRNDG